MKRKQSYFVQSESEEEVEEGQEEKEERDGDIIECITIDAEKIEFDVG